MLLDGIAFRTMKTRDYSKLFLWVPKLALQPIFMWPLMENYHVKSTVAILLLVPFLLFNLVGLTLKISSIEKMADLAFSSVMFMAFFQYKLKPLRELLENVMTKFWPFDLFEGNIQEDLKSFYFNWIVFMAPLAPMCGLFLAGILITSLFMEERTLSIPVKYPWECTVSPIYEIIFAIQVISYPILMSGILGTDFLFLCITASAVSQCKILQKCFLLYNSPEMVITKKKIDNIKLYPDDDRKQFFVTCLKQHHFIIRFTKTINKVFGPMVLAQLSCSTAEVCISIFLLTQPSITAIELYLSVLTGLIVLNELFIYSIIGNQLQYEASLIPKFIYDSNWRELENTKMKKDFMLVLQYAQQDVQLSAYGLFDLSMTSFLKVVKFAFSIYTVLSQMS